MPRPGPWRIRRSLPNTPAKSRRVGPASTRCRTTSGRRSRRVSLRPIAGNSCRTNRCRSRQAPRRMKVRYTPAAFSDRERIIEYLRERSACRARNVAASIREAVAQLNDHPHSGYRTDAPDVRVIFVGSLPLQDLLSTFEIPVAICTSCALHLRASKIDPYRLTICWVLMTV